jgi:hypothetical protein
MVRKVMNVILAAVLLYAWFTSAVFAAPTVSAVAPDPSTLPVTPISTNFTVTFSEAMDPATITGTNATIYLTPATAATVTYNNATNQATFSPTTALLPGIYNPNPNKQIPGTVYTLTVNGVKNLSGVPVTAASYTYHVTPSLTLDPNDGQTDIAATTTKYPISVTFTEAMDESTINGTTFTVSAQGVNIAGKIGPDTINSIPNRFIFMPDTPLVAGTEYTATLTTGIRTLANGKNLPANVVWKFSTIAPLATVTATSPTASAVDVATTTTVQAFFSMAMTASTLTTTTFTLTSGSTPVAGTVTYNATTNSATFSPLATLAEGTAYTAAISSQAQDSLGRNLAAPYSWSFTTVFPSVKLLPSGLFYDLLQAAYNASNNGDTITLLARVYDFKEKLDFNKQVSVLLRGGYDSGFATQTGYATLNGDLTVTSGVLTVDRLIVAP